MDPHGRAAAVAVLGGGLDAGDGLPARVHGHPRAVDRAGGDQRGAARAVLLRGDPGPEPRLGDRARRDRQPDRRGRDDDRQAPRRVRPDHRGAGGRGPAQRRHRAGDPAHRDRGAGASVSLGGVLGDFVFAVGVGGGDRVRRRPREPVRPRAGRRTRRSTRCSRSRCRSSPRSRPRSSAPRAWSRPSSPASPPASTRRGCSRRAIGSSDRENWRTVELILEGGVFLVMGLELSAIVDEAEDELGTAVTRRGGRARADAR